jgi:AraC-like DNA-binding protein
MQPVIAKSQQWVFDSSKIRVIKPLEEARKGDRPHRHPEGQLTIIGDGVLAMEVDGKSSMLSPGQVCWMPPNVLHSGTGFGVTIAWNAYIPSHMCGQLELPSKPGVYRTSQLLTALLVRISSWAGKDQPLGDAQRHLLAVLADELRQAPIDALGLPMPRDPRLRRLAIELFTDPSAKINLAYWCEKLAIPERTMTRRFRVETGMSLTQWRTMARMCRAVEFLSAGQSVTNAALELGYQSSSAFVAVYRRTFGTTPARGRPG